MLTDATQGSSMSNFPLYMTKGLLEGLQTIQSFSRDALLSLDARSAQRFGVRRLNMP